MDATGAGQYDEKINGFSAFLAKSVNNLTRERELIAKYKKAAQDSYANYKVVY